MYPTYLQNKIILNNTNLQTIENIKKRNKKTLQGNVMGKNILESIEKGKKIPPQQDARKKNLAGPKSLTLQCYPLTSYIFAMLPAQRFWRETVSLLDVI